MFLSRFFGSKARADREEAQPPSPSKSERPAAAVDAFAAMDPTAEAIALEAPLAAGIPSTPAGSFAQRIALDPAAESAEEAVNTVEDHDAWVRHLATRKISDLKIGTPIGEQYDQWLKARAKARAKAAAAKPK